MKELSCVTTTSGESVYTFDYISEVRKRILDKQEPLKITAQAGAQERMLAIDADIKICGGSRGGPLVVDTKVVTPFGYRRIVDIKAGDIITSTDGGMQKVLYRKDFKRLPCYKLKFVDGSEVIASYDHLWNVRKTCYRSKKRILNNLSLSEDYRVWTTQMIVEHLEKQKKEGLNSRLIIPLCSPVKFTVSRKRYGIDPYLLGVILGDGCITDSVLRHKNIMFTTVDDEILQAFKEQYPDVHSRTAYKPIDYIFKSQEFVEALEKMGLAGHNAESKFVPFVFKFGTVEERFAILQGLMDTDGTVDKRGHLSFSSISQRLAEDVKHLVNSLGGLATVSKGEGHYTKDGEKFRTKDVYTVYIRINESVKLFRLKRKKDLCTEYNGGISELGRRIIDFEYVGKKDCCCIAVNNTNSLFMVDDFVVTHNSKSFSLLLEGKYDVRNKDFHGILLRNESKDLDSLITDSYKVFSQDGDYNKSVNDMTWNFYNGGWLKFSYYTGAFEDFKTRFQGRQYSFIGIDEITQMPYKKFKYLITNNRNASGLRNRIWGTCNPDPDSWVRKFIDWWIGDDGYPIQERDGVVRYLYMNGDRPDDIYWGNTKEEVYEQCKDIIDGLWSEEYDKLGYDKLDMFIKSATFIRADLSENILLTSTDKSYFGNLAQQDEEQRMRDLKGNWNWRNAGDDMIKADDLERMFNNAEKQDDGTRYASCDIAFTGGDNLVMWLWIGHHVQDLCVLRVKSDTAISAVKAKLSEWGVKEENFTYDMQGIGQSFQGFFRNATPFNNQGTPIAKDWSEEKGIRFLYKDLKSQCAWLFAQDIKNGEISIEDYLLEQKYSGDGFSNTPLRLILQKERKCIRQDEESSDTSFRLIKKKVMKRYVGHSPDFFESLLYRKIFDLTKSKHKKPRNLWMI